MASADKTPVPFSFFVSLCREIRNIAPRPIRNGSDDSCETNIESTTLKTFKRWVQELRRRFPNPPSQTTATLFLLLFPEEDTRRRYGMKETGLAKELLSIFGISDKDGDRGARLKRWSSPTSNFSSLGEQLYDLLSHSCACCDTSSGLSLISINMVLDDLASKSQFSASSIRSSSDSSSKARRCVLRDTFTKLDPFEAATLTQIILKDVRPILYPTKNVSSSESLLRHNSKAVHMLTMQEAMRIWDPSNTLLRCYRIRSTIEDAVHLFEGEYVLTGTLRPEIDVPIQIPKCFKAQGCREALTKLNNATTVWAETKYDGERMQIHVTVNEHGQPQITIFSKSKRDSTLDRAATHWIIQEALGLSHDSGDTRARPLTTRCYDMLSSAILEAEMVAYDKEFGIDEFWRIRELVESSATGARRKTKRKQLSLGSESSRHLALVFFDILYLNGTSLLLEPYASRRTILEGIIDPIPMYAYLAHRAEIPLLCSKDFNRGLSTLEHIFAVSIANHEEGLVLKAGESTYGDCRYPWVKLKKDYIPGLGDSLDLVLIGASWDKDRGRSLRVPTSTYTTFYAGAIDSRAKSAHSRPAVEVLFAVSYGLDRRQLEELNFLIKSSCATGTSSNVDQLPFALHLPDGLPKPQMLLSNPILVEVLGAGFTKTNETKNYELRFPRITKLYRPKDRSWLESITLSEFNDIALAAVGKRSSGVDKSDHVSVAPQDSSKDKRLALEARQVRDPFCLNSDEPCEHYATGKANKRKRTDENDCSVIGPEQEKRSCQPPGLKVFRNYTVIPFKSLTNWEPSHATRFNFTQNTRNQGHRGSGFDEQGGNHPFARFLRPAIILLECCIRDCDATFVNEHILPNVVHSRAAFAVGCGWKLGGTEGSGSCYGVVFVDGESSRNWCEPHPFDGVSKDHDTKHKPIFVFSNDLLRCEALRGGRTESELDIKSKCLSVYL